MIPLCFAYYKVNYARFLTYYPAKMSQLHIEYPKVHAHFLDGGFSVEIGILTYLVGSACVASPDYMRPPSVSVLSFESNLRLIQV